MKTEKVLSRDIKIQKSSRSRSRLFVCGLLVLLGLGKPEKSEDRSLSQLKALPCGMLPKRLKESKPRSGFIEEAQYRILAANCSKELWLRIFLAQGFNFGCRKGEMLALRVFDIDLLHDGLHIADSRNGEARNIVLTQETKKLLAACIRG
jgi:integrase